MIKRMWVVLTWLKANLVWSIPVAMLLGLAFGAVVNPAFLKPLTLPWRPKEREVFASEWAPMR